MGELFFQIVLFLAGAVIGIAAPLLQKRHQKIMAATLAMLLIITAAVWFGYVLGYQQASTSLKLLLMSPTPCPAGPLCEVFQQVDDGKSFSWAYPPNSFLYQFDADCAHSGSYGIRLQFGFVPDADNGGWGVNWNNPLATHFNASKFTALVFWVQGTTGNEVFQIGLKDTTLQEIKTDSKDWVIPNDLKKGTIVTIPLNTFSGVAIASLSNVSFGFNKASGSGNICIDDIAFERK